MKWNTTRLSYFYIYYTTEDNTSKNIIHAYKVIDSLRIDLGWLTFSCSGVFSSGRGLGAKARCLSKHICRHLSFILAHLVWRQMTLIVEGKSSISLPVNCVYFAAKRNGRRKGKVTKC